LAQGREEEPGRTSARAQASPCARAMASADLEICAAAEQVKLLGVDAATDALPKERKDDTGRVMDLITKCADQPDDSPLKQGLACFLKYGVQPLLCIGMVYVWIFKKLYYVYTFLPMNIIQMIFAIALCFYGGHFLMSIAAIEAFRNMGGQNFLDDMAVMWAQGTLVAAASAEDDKKDDDKNGIMDVQEISNKDLINRKTKVGMMAVTEPQRLQVAVGNLWAAYMSVLAVLRLEFARTIAIALGIASMLEISLIRWMGPLVAYILGKDLNHWVYTVCSTIIKVTAMAIAWYMQTIISAFYSAIRGGRLFATALFNIFSERGWMDRMPDCLVKKPFDPDESYLDECIAYPLAAFGFYMQWEYGFALPFPQNIALFPLTCVEWIIRWQVTFS